MSSGPSGDSARGDEGSVDVFVSYAHADDEVPVGAEQGWVTTLVGELQKVLRRKLGGSGARVWMDHQLAANQPVTEELLRRIDGSRTLLLVMSPGYRKSAWCQREAATYVARAAARGRVRSVFPIEIEPMEREDWPPGLNSLTPIRFWEQAAQQIAPKLAGFPEPKPDEDSLYWRNVTELAHLIAKRLQAAPNAGSDERKTAVVVAEVTDDLDDSRQLVESSLQQRSDVVVLPARPYPRGAESDFLAALRSDLKSAAMFVQLLGAHQGKRAPGSERSFVAMQAQEAMRCGPPVMQWRPPELRLERIADPSYRELLAGRHVSCLGFEAFRQAVLQAVEGLVPERQETARVRQVTPAIASIDGQVFAEGLSLYLQATPEDRDTADQIADQLATAGASVQLSPDPAPGQPFLQSLMAQEDALRLCHGVLLIYGRSPVNAISTAFQYALRVFGVKRPGIWSAVLDLPPLEKPRVPIRSPNLMTIECRQGFDSAKLGIFFDALRAGGQAHA
jgi:hypothetical protein